MSQRLFRSFVRPFPAGLLGAATETQHKGDCAFDIFIYLLFLFFHDYDPMHATK
jgi:hypothetical protein